MFFLIPLLKCHRLRHSNCMLDARKCGRMGWRAARAAASAAWSTVLFWLAKYVLLTFSDPASDRAFHGTFLKHQ